LLSDFVVDALDDDALDDDALDDEPPSEDDEPDEDEPDDELFDALPLLDEDEDSLEPEVAEPADAPALSERESVR